MKALTRVAAGLAALALALGGVTASASARALPAASVEDDYSIYVELEDANPRIWAGGFVEDGVLIIRTTMSVAQATALLRAAGVSDAVEVRHTDVSHADLMALTDEITDLRIPAVVQIGPWYARGLVRVGALEITPEVDALIATYGDRIVVEIQGAVYTTSGGAHHPAYKSPITRILNQRFARLATQWGADARAMARAGRGLVTLPAGLSTWMHSRPDLYAPAMHRVRGFAELPGNALQVRFAYGDCAKGEIGTRVYETDAAVYVAAFHAPLWSRLTDRGCTASGHVRQPVVHLSAPLGARPVIDAVTGKSVVGARLG